MSPERITTTWTDLEETEPDIATERLIVMVAQTCRVGEDIVLDAVFGTGPLE